MPPGGGGAPIAGPGWPGVAAGCALPAGFSRNSPMRCCPHDWQLSGGVGRRTSVPQFPHTKVFSMDSSPFCIQQVVACIRFLVPQYVRWTSVRLLPNV